MILIMKDLWFLLNEDKPPAEQQERWTRDQQKALAVIHLHCEREQKLLISDTETGIDAWEILAEKYSSTDVVNILKVDEAFGKARKKLNQSISA